MIAMGRESTLIALNGKEDTDKRDREREGESEACEIRVQSM